MIPGVLAAAEGNMGVFEVTGCKVRARLGKQNPPQVGKDALLIVRPENLSLDGQENSLPIRVLRCLFEGDRLDYHAELAIGDPRSVLSLSVPFLPGTQIRAGGASAQASFDPRGAVIIATPRQ